MESKNKGGHEKEKSSFLFQKVDTELKNLTLKFAEKLR